MHFTSKPLRTRSVSCIREALSTLDLFKQLVILTTKTLYSCMLFVRGKAGTGFNSC